MVGPMGMSERISLPRFLREELDAEGLQELEAEGLRENDAKIPENVKKGDAELLSALRDMLGDSKAFSDFNIRHTKYGFKERVLHFFSFGHAYSDIASAYHLEKKQAAEFSKCISNIHSHLVNLRPGHEEGFVVMLPGSSIAIQINQDPSGNLSAKIAGDGDLSKAESFSLPFTARELSNKIVTDMLERPQVYTKYDKNALRNAIFAGNKDFRTPLRREIYEKVLQNKLSVTSDELSKISNLGLRNLAKDALDGVIKSRKGALERIDTLIANKQELQSALKITDEQATSLTEHFEAAMVKDAARVNNAVNISALEAPKQQQLSPEMQQIEARNTRVHNFFADIVLNREAAVHDKNMGQDGTVNATKRLQETFLANTETLAEILMGDDSVMDTMGEDMSAMLKLLMMPIKASFNLFKVATVGMFKAVPAEPAARQELVQQWLNSKFVGEKLFNAFDAQVDTAVNKVMDQLKKQVTEAVGNIREAGVQPAADDDIDMEPLPTKEDIEAAPDNKTKITLFMKMNGALVHDLAKKFTTERTCEDGQARTLQRELSPLAASRA